MTALVLRTSEAAATRALGQAIASVCRAGDLVLLAGELGAGKTVLTQGIAEGLAVTAPVTSPTFTLVHRYDGRLPLFHVDVYRLDRTGELVDIGLDELLDSHGLVVVEWGDAIASELPVDRLEVRLTFGEGDDDRTIEISASGPRWPARWHELRQATKEWQC